MSSEIVVPEEGKTFILEFNVKDHCGAEDTGSLPVNIEYVSSRPTLPPRTAPPADTTTTIEITKKINTTPTTQPAKTLRTTKAAATTETKTKQNKTTKSSLVTTPNQVTRISIMCSI